MKRTLVAEPKQASNKKAFAIRKPIMILVVAMAEKMMSWQGAFPPLLLERGLGGEASRPGRIKMLTISWFTISVKSALPDSSNTHSQKMVVQLSFSST